MCSLPVSKLDLLLAYLSQEFDGYAFSMEKDRKYFERLIVEFQDIDIEDELRQYHAWVLDQPDGKKIYYRSRFRSWLKTAREFKENRATLTKPQPWLRRRYAASRY